MFLQSILLANAGVANCAADMLSRNNVTNFLLLQSQTSRLPIPLPAQLLNIITPKARLDISQLPQSVQQYYTNGAAKAHGTPTLQASSAI